jgi:hypothetical protein
MRHFIQSSWLSLPLCAALSLGGGAVAAEPEGSALGTPRVIVAPPAEKALAHLSWPKIVRTADGTLVVAYIAGAFHGPDGGGCPAVSRSTDGGKSFSPPHVLARHDRTTRYTSGGNVALGIADDGAVVLLAMAYTGNTRNTVEGWRSTDAGLTWTPVDTSTLADNKTGSVFGHVFPVPGKGLAVAGHYRAGSTPFTQGLWIAYSTDHGRTWGAPTRITGQKQAEPVVVHAGGKLIGMFRPNTTVYTQGVSTDGGATWQLAEMALPPGDPTALAISPALFLDPAHPGRLYALQTERHPPQNTPGHITLWQADAATLQWQRVATLVTFPATLGARNDFGYPWMTPLDADHWFLVFYCGKMHGANAIYGMPITLPRP